MGRVLFIGPGRVGLALGYALWQADVADALTYCGRRPEPPSHPVFGQGTAEWHFGLRAPRPDERAVVLAVPDDVLPEMAHALAGHGPPPSGTVALHTAGGLGPDVLAPLHAVGYSVGTFHPLQPILHPVFGADRLEGSGFLVSGERGARAVAQRWVAALGGHALDVPASRRPMAHAALGLAANGAMALMAVAVEALARSGVDPDVARAAVGPLVRGTVEEVERRGFAEGLSGSLGAGDSEAVGLHLRALEGDARELYRLVGRLAVDAAIDEGRSIDELGALHALLQSPGGTRESEST